MPESEEPLHGGNTSTVHRIGDTVRRAVRPWSANVQALLTHVRLRGVVCVPLPLGYDERGREVLSFIPGDVPHDTPAWLWADSILEDAAKALRQWHDATTDFTPLNSSWGLEPRPPAEVICHNDFAPYNCVFREQQLVSLIDFDTCAPGPRVWDMAYALYRFVPLMPPASDPAASAFDETSPFPWPHMLQRAERFLDAYAAADATLRLAPAAVIRIAALRLQALAAWTERHRANQGEPSLLRHARMYRLHAAWLDAKF